MAITTDLLVTSPTLQCFYVNKNGLPLAGGIITCYQDNSRTTLKNWYYQSGSPGNYSYITLPNPLTLSAAGSIQDVNGNDTLPFFYPVSELDDEVPEPYYITVVDSNLTAQFSRQNFPFTGTIEPSPLDTIATLENYIINNRFWRNIGSVNATTLVTDPTSGLLSVKLAPSQHDGFSMPDLQFIKNVNGAVDTITFTTFTPNPIGQQILIGDITPEYYINHVCSSQQAGELTKYYQFPISLHVATLANQPFTVTIQAQSAVGSINNTLSISILQFLGTGVISSSPQLIKTFTINNTWTKYNATSVFQPTTGLTLGNGQDDAYYLQIGIPVDAIVNINFTLPSLYLSTQPDIPTNDFSTYDQIDSVITTPRTGDIRTSLNDFFYFGWVPMNDGTIGFTNSLASNRRNADTWPLYNLLWQHFNVYTQGTQNLLAQMFNTSGTAIGYGASTGSTAISDFNAGNSLALTKMMGNVLLGTVPPPTLTANYSTNFSASNSGGLLLFTTAGTVNFFNGMPFYVTTGGTLPGGITINTIYYVANFDGVNHFNVAISFSNAINPVGNVIAFTTTGTNVNNVVIAELAGTVEGEYAHSTLTNEMPAHQHTIPISIGVQGSTGLATQSLVAPTPSTNTSIVGGTNAAPLGNVTPMNVTQPGTFYNMYMKL